MTNDQKQLKAILQFKAAWKELNENWSTNLDEHYPFDESFDEIDIDKWLNASIANNTKHID